MVAGLAELARAPRYHDAFAQLDALPVVVRLVGELHRVEGAAPVLDMAAALARTQALPLLRAGIVPALLALLALPSASVQVWSRHHCYFMLMSTLQLLVRDALGSTCRSLTLLCLSFRPAA